MSLWHDPISFQASFFFFFVRQYVPDWSSSFPAPDLESAIFQDGLFILVGNDT